MSSHSKREILLVDDNPADLDLIREALSGVEPKHVVNIVQDGELAIAFLTHSGQFRGASRPDLVILDLNVPRKDGRAVLANVKLLASGRTPPRVTDEKAGPRTKRASGKHFERVQKSSISHDWRLVRDLRSSDSVAPRLGAALAASGGNT